MSLLVVQLPPRERLSARAGGGEPAAGLRLPAEWPYVYSPDGDSAGPVETAPAARLPRATRTVLVVDAADLSWHALTVPKAPAARLRAALSGVIEEALLDDDDSVHLALAPGSQPGRPGWAVATHGPRLAAALEALEQAGVAVEQVVPAAAPVAAGAPVRGHFHADDGADEAPWLTLARADGVSSLRLAGTLARALLPAPDEPVRWTATPAAAAAAERWLGHPVPLQTEGEQLLEAARSSANLRQFDLAGSRRGTRALRGAGQRLLTREWRPVRWGLAALLVLQVGALNAHAWQQRRALQADRDAAEALLRGTFPAVRTVLDAPAQMQAETDRLRAASGRPGGADFEVLLGAAASAWPASQGPAADLRYDGERLTLAAAGWRDEERRAFEQQLRASGFAVEAAGGRVAVGRSAAGAAGAAR